MSARSYLFVPGDRPERYAKALASGADAVIVDLEDAVAPAAKAAARAALAAWLGGGNGPVVVRIDAAGSEWFDADLALLAQPGIAAVMLAKAERHEDLATVREAAPSAALLPLIETAAGFDRLREIAAAPGVQRLVFGSIDLLLDLGIEEDAEHDTTEDGGNGNGNGDALLLYRSQLVLASRLANLAAPVDGVCARIDDATRLDVETARARRFGFGAKLCIHPRQVAAVNAAFAPSASRIAWAEKVVQAAARAHGAVVAVDGAMVDRPVLLRAEAVLRAAARTNAAPGGSGVRPPG